LTRAVSMASVRPVIATVRIILLSSICGDGSSGPQRQRTQDFPPLSRRGSSAAPRPGSRLETEADDGPRTRDLRLGRPHRPGRRKTTGATIALSRHPLWALVGDLSACLCELSARRLGRQLGVAYSSVVPARSGCRRRFGAGGVPNVRRTCSSVEASSSWVASRVASPCSQRRVAARLSPVQHSSA
jgi:hypothetical protein